MTNWLSHATGALRPLGNSADRPSLTRRALDQRMRPPTLRDRFLAMGWANFLRSTFILFFVAPVALTAFYEFFVASPSYVTSTRLAIREATDRPLVETYITANAFAGLPSPSADRQRASGSGMRVPGGSSTAAAGRASSLVNSVVGMIGGRGGPTEPFIINDYISSLELVTKLDQDHWLRSRFAAGDPDWLQALPEGSSQETLLNYWRSVASASLDTTSGLITFTVKAFTPEDSQAIAARVVAECDALLSRMMERSRHDRMEEARQLLARAQDRYVEAQGAIRALRAEEYQIDPELAAKTSFKQLMELISARIALDVQLRVMSPGLDEDAPQLKVLKARIAALDAEIVRAKAALTATGESPGAASNYLAAFEGLETERMLAVSLYQSALDGLERVRLASERQAFYLAVFVPPLTPDYAAGPDVKGSLGIVALLGLLAWGIVAVTAAASRDHVSVPR